MHVFWEGHKNWWIWQYVVTVKLTVKFSSIFVGFLENMNFTKDSKTNHTWALSIVKFWHVFCTILLHFYSRRSGPGPLGPVRKILVVRSGPEGPQFPRSVGTLQHTNSKNPSYSKPKLFYLVTKYLIQLFLSYSKVIISYYKHLWI